jgi:hypothetical protein
VYDYVVTDTIPVNKQTFYGTNGFVAAALWENMSVAMRKLPADYLNSYFIGPVPPGADPKFYAPANYFFFVKDSTLTGSVGELMVKYNCWLLEPTLENGSASPAAAVSHYSAASGTATTWTYVSGSTGVTVNGLVGAFNLVFPNVSCSYYISGSAGNATAAETKAVNWGLSATNTTTGGITFDGPGIMGAEANCVSSNAATSATVINTTSVGGTATALGAGGVTGTALMFSARIRVVAGTPINPAIPISIVAGLTNANTTFGTMPAWLYIVRLPASITSERVVAVNSKTSQSASAVPPARPIASANGVAAGAASQIDVKGQAPAQPLTATLPVAASGGRNPPPTRAESPSLSEPTDVTAGLSLEDRMALAVLAHH